MLRALIGLFLAVGLTGCADLDLASDAPPVQKAALLGGAVNIAGPAGYCVDVADSRLTRGFALLAPCSNLGLAGTPRAGRLALITVQAGRAGTASVAGSEPAFAGFLETAEGAALLSQSGSGDTIKVLKTTSNENKVVVSFEDSEDTPLTGTQTREWRAFVDINGRLVTIGVRGAANAPLGDTSGAQMIDAAVAAIVAANAT